jgi:hypothetical protein
VNFYSWAQLYDGAEHMVRQFELWEIKKYINVCVYISLYMYLGTNMLKNHYFIVWQALHCQTEEKRNETQNSIA